MFFKYTFEFEKALFFKLTSEEFLFSQFKVKLCIVGRLRKKKFMSIKSILLFNLEYQNRQETDYMTVSAFKM